MMINSQYSAPNDVRISPLEAMLLFVIFVIPLWPRYAIIYIKGMPNINLTRILVFILIFIWIIVLLGPNKNYVRNIRENYNANKSIIRYLLILFVLKYLSVLFSPQLTQSLYIVTDEFVSYFILFLVGLTVWQTPQQISRALLIIIASSLIVSLFGLYEAYLEHNILSDIFPSTTEFIEKALEEKYREGYRIKSTFNNPLSLAEYLVFIVPITIVLFFNNHNLFVRSLCFVSVILAMLTIWKTESRGAIVVMLIMGYVFFVLKLINKIKTQRGINRIFITTVVIPIAILITILSFALVSNLTKGRSKMEIISSTGRLEQLKTGLSLVFRRPLLGYSPGGSGIITLWLNKTSIDNYYLLLAMESGLFTLILFIYILIRFIKLSLINYNRLDGSPKAIVGVLGLSLIGFTTFMTVLSLKQVFPLVFLSFAMILSFQSDTSVTSRLKGDIYN